MSAPPASSRPLRVVQVIPALDAGGAERTAVDVAAAVVAAGGQSWIATQGGRLAAEAQSKGATLVIGDFATKNPWRILTNATRLARLVQAEGIDILHARSRAPAWSAWRAARMANCRYVATYHGIYNARNPLKRWYNAIMTRGDAIIANSAFTAAHVSREHHVPLERIDVIPRGIDIDAFTPAHVTAQRIDAIRRQWNLEGTSPVILLPGRLTRWKGQLDFIAALARLPDRNFIAVLAGDAQERDGYLAELRAAIAAAGLEANTRIPGHCSDMPAAFMAADVIVAPSIEPEAFGRVAVEAQAMGKPLVASRLGAQTETVRDGTTGFLFNPGSVDELSAALAKARALTADIRTSMAAAQRSNVLGQYTVVAMCAATLAVYERIGRKG
ncbi:MAG: glycosyltransferase family 4 protein [Alphaproteobacteria bacterium]|nr:glycosyltransferase family 4 protein [Alphaproteobacteria bacterium]